MKSLKNIIAIELLFLFLLISCSMERRHYLPGYHIEWEGSNKKKKASAKIVQREFVRQTDGSEIAIEKDSEAVINFAPASFAKEEKRIIPITKTESRIVSNENYRPVTFTNNMNASVPDRISEKMNKKSEDGIFAILGGLIGLLTLGGLKIGKGKIKKISYWANKNKWKARGALTGIKMFLGGLGLYLGSVLYNNDVLIGNITTNALVAISLCAAFLYPERNTNHKFNAYSYTRQKTFDLILSMSGFMLMASIGNQASASRNYFPVVSSFNQQVDKSIGHFSGFSFHRAERMTNNIKSIYNENYPKRNSEKSGGEIIGNIFLTILAVALFALLEYLILALSCTLSCNGSEAAAVIVGVGGTILNILLFVAIIKAIFKTHTKEVKNNEAIPQRR